MPEFSPEQYQFIGWFVVAAGSFTIGAILILRKLGIELSFKRNGNPMVAQGGNGDDLKTVKGLAFGIKSDTECLKGNDKERAKTLGEIRDYSRDGVKLQEQVLAETRRQTDQLMKLGKR